MQKVELDNDLLKLYCPVTGELILSQDDFNPSPAVLFCFNEDSFMHVDETVSALLKKYNFDETDKYLDHDDFSKFLSDSKNLYVLHHDVILFEITHSGIACGPSSSTTYIAVDTSYVSPEDLEEMEKDVFIEGIKEYHTMSSFRDLLKDKKGDVIIKIKDEIGVIEEIRLNGKSEDLAMLCFYEDLDATTLEKVKERPKWNQKINLFHSYAGESQWENEFPFEEFFDFLNEIFEHSQIIGYQKV